MMRGTQHGSLLLPLPFIAYKVLKFVLSLLLLYAAGFFLRPCKKLGKRGQCANLDKTPIIFTLSKPP